MKSRSALFFVLTFWLITGLCSHVAADWDIEVVDGIAEGIGEYCSLVLDSGNNPHISYHAPTLTKGRLKYKYKDASGWHEEIFEALTDDIGLHTSIAVGSNNDVHISCYRYFDNDALMYVLNTNNPALVDHEGDVGEYTSIALDSNGNPHISYYNSDEGILKHAYKTGLIWRTEIVDDGDGVDDVGLFTSIAIDSSDNIHISYHDYLNDALKYINNIGGTWGEPVEIESGFMALGEYTSIALDSYGNPHISYYDEEKGALKYAYNGDLETPGEWELTQIDNGSVGKYTSIALDSSDNPHISYYDEANGDLKYASSKDRVWNTAIVDSNGDVGQYSSLALDSSDKPLFCYYDTAGALKYAQFSTGNSSATSTTSISGDDDNGGGGGGGGDGDGTTTTVSDGSPTSTTTSTSDDGNTNTSTTTVASTTTAPGTDTTTSITTTTTTRFDFCVIERLLSENSQSELYYFRQYRDKKLAVLPAGKSLIELYYAHSAEVSRILFANPAHSVSVKNLITEIAAQLSDTLESNKTLRLTNAQYDTGMNLLHFMQQKASPGLYRDITATIKELESGKLFKQLKITINTNS